MSQGKKTDNARLGDKLELRSYFLSKYHEAPPRVFDACQGSGTLWSHLRQRHEVASYWGVDVKPKKGRLKIDSARVLEQPGWSFDVVDIDTYGAPWRHWDAVLEHLPGPCTVFLTAGATMFRGGTDTAAAVTLGLGPILSILPETFFGFLTETALSYCLAKSYISGVRIVECREAPANQRTRYLGIRLEPMEKSAPATGGPP